MLSFFRKLFGLEEEIEVEDPMKYLIVGLGNIGTKYVGTRHNIGFEAVDFMNQELGGEFKIEPLGALSHCKYKGRQMYFLKPSTFMNLSGKSVRYWMQKKKIFPDNLLIITDDLNLPFNKIRLRKKGGDGGHNGLKSIEQMLQTSSYARLRIGIGDDFGKKNQVDYVLGNWREDEITELTEILGLVTNACKSFVTIGVDRTMSQHNN